MDKQTVLKVAKLARLKIEDARADQLAGDFSAILKWVEQLGEVDTTGVEPMSSVVGQAAYRRPDVITDGDKQKDVTANAPDTADGFFIVPKVIE